MSLSHINESGYAHMVSVHEKEESLRVALAVGKSPFRATFNRVKEGGIKKGGCDYCGSNCRYYGGKANQRLDSHVPSLEPLGVDFKFDYKEDACTIMITCEVKVLGKTGVEMEALTGVSLAALTIYDMCKAMDKSMTIEKIYLKEKIGGKSGHYRHHQESEEE